MSRSPKSMSFSLLTVLFTIALAFSAQAATGPSVEVLRSADGTVAASALTGSTYSGPLDLTGFTVTLDPENGPLVQDENTYNYLQGERTQTVIRAAALYDGLLILAGKFAPVGRTYSTNIVGWDGAHWVSIGRFGTNGTVFDLAVYEGKLIAAGDFTTAGNDVVNNIASWDGQYFSSMSRGLDAPVFSLAVHRHQLLAAGLSGLGLSYGIERSGVVGWDGAHWSCDGLEIQGIVTDIASIGDQLAVTGQFFGYPIGQPDTTLFFDGASWGSTTGTHAGVASVSDK